MQRIIHHIGDQQQKIITEYLVKNGRVRTLHHYQSLSDILAIYYNDRSTTVLLDDMYFVYGIDRLDATVYEPLTQNQLLIYINQIVKDISQKKLAA